MIYYDFSDILRGILYAAFFGALISAFSLALDVAFAFFKGIFLILENVIRNSDSIKSAKAFIKTKFTLTYEERKIIVFFKDLIFCLFSGLLISFLLYLSADGKVRIYLLAISLLVYIFCKKTAVRWMGNLIFHFLELTIKFMGVILIFTFLPLRRITSGLIKNMGLLIKETKALKKKTPQKRKTVHKNEKINCAK